MEENEKKKILWFKKGNPRIWVVFFLIIILVLTTLFFLQLNTAKKQVVNKIEKENQFFDANKNIEEEDTIETSLLSFDVSERVVGVGEKFALKAVLKPEGKKVNAVDLYVTFDPNFLKLEKINPSDVFSLVLAKQEVDNAKGFAHIVLAVPLEREAAGDLVEIAVFDFKTLSNKGASSVSFSDKTVAAAENEKKNVVQSRIATKIIIE